MTRAEFLENVRNWGDLLDFCNEEGCYVCEDIYDENMMDDYINENLVQMARNYPWQELLDKLQSIQTGFCYYRHDEYGDFIGLDDEDLDDLLADVLEWGDDNNIWDCVEDEEDDDPQSQDADEEEADWCEPEEGCCVADLFSSGTLLIQEIRSTKKQEDDRYEAFIKEREEIA